MNKKDEKKGFEVLNIVINGGTVDPTGRLGCGQCNPGDSDWGCSLGCDTDGSKHDGCCPGGILYRDTDGDAGCKAGCEYPATDGICTGEPCGEWPGCTQIPVTTVS